MGVWCWRGIPDKTPIWVNYTQRLSDPPACQIGPVRRGVNAVRIPRAVCVVDEKAYTCIDVEATG